MVMVSFIERVVLRLREDPAFSRNRHFLALSSPEGRKALRIHRHLRSIENDLSRGCSARVEHDQQRVCLILTGRRGRRVAYLTTAEFRLLCASPIVRAALGAAAVPA